MSKDDLKSKIEFVKKMKRENPRAFEFLGRSATNLLQDLGPKCAQCGKPCDRERSFNWKGGVRYLCSQECEETSRSWRLLNWRKNE